MTSIEDKVVKMTFDNAKFEAGVAQTLKSLDALNKNLALTGATKGMTDLGSAAKNVSLSHIEQGVQSIADKFHALSIIGITALTNIANKAINAGTTLIKSLTIDPVKTGLAEYETNLNSIQTILANTGLEGAKGLAKVTAALDELNHYSDQTIYNFSEMARNIGTFTAAGVDLKTATEAIKGIANLAAISGSNSQQASTAMYQLSQAISAGKVSLEDWNSVVNAGMGGKVFQNALMETARIHGVAIDKMVKEEGSFRLTLQKGWLTSSILTETLSKFTGDLTRDQLKAMKYTDAQIEAILKMGKTAQDAATKIKTASQLINTLQESAVSGWSQTWALVFGDFDQAKELFTGVNEVLGGFISTSADARNKVLKDWNELGGRTSLIYSIGNAFHFVMDILKPIRDAFRQIFPATTGQQLFTLTQTIRDFTEKLSVSAETADKIRRTFAGLFAVLGIGWDILKAVAGLFINLFVEVGQSSGGFLSVTASIGDFLVALRAAIKEGGLIQKIFSRIGDVLKVPIELIKIFAHWVGELVEKFDAMKAVKFLTGLVGKLEPMAKIGDALLHSWQKLPQLVIDMLNKFTPFANKVLDFFQNLGEGAGDLTSKLDFTKIFGGAGAATFLGIIVTIWNLIRRIGGSGADIVDSIRDSFNQLTDTLGAMQNTLRAATLLQIAAAVALLAVSVTMLSKIDAEGLTRALTAIAVMIGELFTAMAVFEKFIDISDIAELLAMGTALILLSVAINILASAVEKLAGLDWNGLAKGLTGVAVLLAALVVAMKFMPDTTGLIGTSIGLVILAGAIRLLVTSVEALGGLNWEELAKGLIGVGTLLGALTLFTKFAGANGGGVLQGAGIVLLALGIKILTDAVKEFSDMSWMEIARGITAMAGALLAVGLALTLIPPTAPLAAAGAIILAYALGTMADALKSFATMSWKDMARGMTAMAGGLGLIVAALTLVPPSAVITSLGIANIAGGLLVLAAALKALGDLSWEQIGKATVALVSSLTIIAAGMAAIQGALLSAPALLIVATALKILAPVLLLFGQMSWEEIGKGLLMLAGVLTVIGIAGALLTPVIPTLLGLGAAITLLGIGMLAAGAGLLLFSVGLTALSIAGAAGTAALVGMTLAMAGIIPVIMIKLAEGLAAFAEVIAKAGPAFTAAITTVLLAIINAINIIAPQVVATLFKLINLMLNALEDNVPVLTAKGYRILKAFLGGVKDNIEDVVVLSLEIIAKYISGIAKGMPGITQSGVELIISFIEGLASAVRKNEDRMSDAGLDLAEAIIEGMVKGLFKGIGRINKAATEVAKSALKSAMNFLDIHSPSRKFETMVGQRSTDGWAKGLDKGRADVEASSESIAQSSIGILQSALLRAAQIVMGPINLNPVITPVLNLEPLKKQAREMETILRPPPPVIDPNRSRAEAGAVGRPPTGSRPADDGEEGTGSGHTETLIFTQINNSPKPLSPTEIYRNTKNQLSTAKEVLK